jgi:hypothetical protein
MPFDNLDARATSPIIDLFRQWDALYHTGFNPDGADDSDPALDRYCDELRRIEHEMCALPAMSAADFAAKVIAVTNYGDFALGDGDTLLDEAARLIGEARL